MDVALVLGISILLQFAAAILALYLIRVTGYWKAWIFIAGAILLMTVRRGITLYRLVSGDLSRPPDLSAELVALVISALMMVGLAWITPMFLSIRYSGDRLQEERDKAQNYLDIAGVMLLAINADQKISLINKKGCEVLGYREEEVIGKNWFDNFIPGRIRDEERTVFEQLIRSEIEPLEYFENPVLTSDGEEKIIAWHNTLLRDREGNIIGTLNSGEDITEHKKVEEEQRLVSEIMSNMTEGVYLITMKDIKIVWANLKFEEMFGYRPGEMIGKHASIVNAPTDKNPLETAAEITKVLEETGEWHGEVNNIKKDGTPFWCYANVTVFNHPEYGEVMVSVHTDITERKKAEEALQKAHDELERKVEERTKELSEANIRLQELDRLKSMFIASMSHELRTPLNCIIGFTGIILQGMAGEINDEQKKQLSMVKSSAGHLLDLINDIIDLSKIEAGKVELVMEEFDLSGLVREVADSFAAAAADKSISLSLDLPDRLVIESDRRRTKQVLMNLVSNALKFTSKGEIGVQAAPEENGRVKVAVTDTGMGIRAENLGKLFQAFSKIREPDFPRQEGTGLGIYLSKKIVTLLGGTIEVDSTFGKGSRFQVFLPIKKRSAGR